MLSILFEYIYCITTEITGKLTLWKNKPEKLTLALGNFGDAQAYQPLVSTLKEDNLRLVDQAITALGKIGDAQILLTLTKLAEYVADKPEWSKQKRSIAKAIEQIQRRIVHHQ